MYILLLYIQLYIYIYIHSNIHIYIYIHKYVYTYPLCIAPIGSPSQLTFWVTFTFCHQLAAEDLQRLVQLATGFGPTLVPGSVDPLMWKNPITASEKKPQRGAYGGMQKHTPKKWLHLLDVVGCWQVGAIKMDCPMALWDLFLRRCYCLRPALCSAAGAAGAPASGRRFGGDWSGETSLDLAGLVALGSQQR